MFLPVQAADAAVGVGMSAAELDALAEVEHGRWLAAKRQHGFTLGEDRHRKQNPFLKERADLTDGQKSYSVEFVRGMARILALADYAIVPDEPWPTPQAGV